MKALFDFPLGLIENALTSKQLPRIPESEMVVETPEELEDYNDAMQEDARVYITFSAFLISHIIAQSSKVLDIGCGSGDLLLTLAQANPHIQFVGADQSEIAIAEGKKRAEGKGITNVSFIQSNLKNLTGIPDHSFEGIYSRFTIHHLPDEPSLAVATASIQRVLKPEGALWIGDFQRLKSERLIRAISYRTEKKVGPLVSRLFYESLHAAYDHETLMRSFSATFTHGKGIQTGLLPLYFIYRSKILPLSPSTSAYFRSQFASYSAKEKMMYATLSWMFTRGGYFNE